MQIERSLPRTSAETRRYRVPGLASPVTLRECVGDHAIFWQCIVSAQYDFQRFPQSRRLLETYERIARTGKAPLIIDCGGNIGLATTWFAQTLPDARICAVEPDPANFEMMVRNTACFGDRVIAVHGGVWPESGHLKIINPDSGPSSRQVSVDDAPSQNSVRAYTIQELCDLCEAPFPLIVKIDIEGAQGPLFERNTDWVRSTHLITLELDDWKFPWQGTSRPFFACLSALPFDYLLGGESIFCFRDVDAETAAASLIEETTQG